MGLQMHPFCLSVLDKCTETLLIRIWVSKITEIKEAQCEQYGKLFRLWKGIRLDALLIGTDCMVEGTETRDLCSLPICKGTSISNRDAIEAWAYREN